MKRIKAAVTLIQVQSGSATLWTTFAIYPFNLDGIEIVVGMRYKNLKTALKAATNISKMTTKLQKRSSRQKANLTKQLKDGIAAMEKLVELVKKLTGRKRGVWTAVLLKSMWLVRFAPKNSSMPITIYKLPEINTKQENGNRGVRSHQNLI